MGREGWTFRCTRAACCPSGAGGRPGWESPPTVPLRPLAVSLYLSSENRTFFGEGTTPPLRPKMTSGLLTKDRDPLYLFTARNGTHSSIGSPSTAHLYRKDSTQTLRFQAFQHTGRAARGHSAVSRICPMFTYLVHSIALFCAALQCDWPKVDYRKEYIEKKRNSFLQRSRDRRRLLQNLLIQNRNLVRACCDLIPRDPAANPGPAIGIVFAQDVQVRIQRDWVRDP